MKTNINIARNVMHFSHWTGKGYAIFAALGRQVQISGLSIHVCESALLKSALKGIINTTVSCNTEVLSLTEKQEAGWHQNYTTFQGEVCSDTMSDNNIINKKRMYHQDMSSFIF